METVIIVDVPYPFSPQLNRVLGKLVPVLVDVQPNRMTDDHILWTLDDGQFIVERGMS
jgi:hypothetical protein